VLEPEARSRYEALSKQELWNVEDKYDLEVENVLGRRWYLAAPLACALVLDWRQGGGAIELQPLHPGQALEELRLVAKSFGPFDRHLAERKDSAMLETVRRIPVYRVTGDADPSALARQLAAGGLDRLLETRVATTPA
jgi:hypothetical protein